MGKHPPKRPTASSGDRSPPRVTCHNHRGCCFTLESSFTVLQQAPGVRSHKSSSKKMGWNKTSFWSPCSQQNESQPASMLHISGGLTLWDQYEKIRVGTSSINVYRGDVHIVSLSMEGTENRHQFGTIRREMQACICWLTWGSSHTPLSLDFPTCRGGVWPPSKPIAWAAVESVHRDTVTAVHACTRA